MASNSKPRKHHGKTSRSAFRQVPHWVRAKQHPLDPFMAAVLTKMEDLVQRLDGREEPVSYVELYMLSRVMDVNTVLHQRGLFVFDLQPFVDGIDIVQALLDTAATEGGKAGVPGYELPEVTRLVLLGLLGSCRDIWMHYSPAEQKEAWEICEERGIQALARATQARAAP